MRWKRLKNTVYLKADLSERFADRIMQYAKIVLASSLIACLLAMLFSFKLQRIITGPILELAGTAKATLCAVAVALPLGIAAALFTAHFAGPRFRAWFKSSLELLEAMPTVVLGLIAVATLAPWLNANVATLLAILVAVPATPDTATPTVPDTAVPQPIHRGAVSQQAPDPYTAATHALLRHLEGVGFRGAPR